MNPDDEIGEAIESAASSIAKAIGFLEQNAIVQVRKSLLLARIDLEFALGATHLLGKGDEDLAGEEIGVKASEAGSDATPERLKEWLEQAKRHLSQKDYEGAEARLIVAVRIVESAMKSIERRSQKGAVRQPS